MEIESPQEEDPKQTEKKIDLLKNDFLDLDIGSFKIKKKKKVSTISEDKQNADDTLKNLDSNDQIKHVKLDEMNVIKVKFFLKIF